jgi:large subunit ribosomal protein L25
MSNNFKLSAELRIKAGKAEVRRLRRQSGMVPAILYGAKSEPLSIQLKENEVLKAFSMDGIRSHVIELNLAGKITSVVIKDSRAHPTKPKIMHIDFMRVDLNKPIIMSIPLHFVGAEEAPGVKEGGIVLHTMNDLEISGLSKHLPDSIQVDISALQMGEGLHLSDIKLPENISLVHKVDEEYNPSVVHITKPRANVENDEEAVQSEEGPSTEDDSKEEGNVAAGDNKA